jgi:hypothetical protein
MLEVNINGGIVALATGQKQRYSRINFEGALVFSTLRHLYDLSRSPFYTVPKRNLMEDCGKKYGQYIVTGYHLKYVKMKGTETDPSYGGMHNIFMQNAAC